MILLVMIAFWLPGDLPGYCADWSMPSHRACLANLATSPHLDIYSSLLCGEKSSRSPDLQGVTHLGLIYLVMVSSRHFRLIETVVSGFEWIWTHVSRTQTPISNSSLPGRVIVLASFTVLVSFAGCPLYLIRVWIDRLLNLVQWQIRLAWRPLQRITMSGFVSLALCRSPTDAQLLLIGWAAAIAFALNASIVECVHEENQAELRQNRTRSSADIHRKNILNWLKRQIRSFSLLYLFLLPLFWQRSWPPFLTVLSNAVLSPLLGAVLLPLALLFEGVALLRSQIDSAVGLIISAMDRLAAFFPSSEALIPGSLPFSSLSAQLVYVVALSLSCMYADSVLHHPRMQKAGVA